MELSEAVNKMVTWLWWEFHAVEQGEALMKMDIQDEFERLGLIVPTMEDGEPGFKATPAFWELVSSNITSATDRRN